MSTEKSIELHPFSGLSRARPLFFVCHLKKYSISRESRNLEELRQLVIEASPTVPPAGPLTFLMDCLNVLYFLYEARCCGVLWHLLASLVCSSDDLTTAARGGCSDELRRRAFADHSKARKLATKLIGSTSGSAHTGELLRINEGILVKLAKVLKIEHNDLENSQASVEGILRLARQGRWLNAESRAKKRSQAVDSLVLLALKMGNPEKAVGICTGCCGTTVHEIRATVHAIRDLVLKEFVLEENVIWVDQKHGLAEAERHFAGVEVVGIDSEWIQISQPRRHKVSILQIATEEKVFIFDLIELYQTERSALEGCLQLIFHSHKIWKVGYSLNNDMAQLYRSYGSLECFSFCESTLDLQRIYPSSHGGLCGLTENVLNRRLDKSLQMSDWGRRPLSTGQIQYAALDAIVPIAIFKVTQKTEGTESCKSKLKCWTPTEKDKGHRWQANVDSKMHMDCRYI